MTALRPFFELLGRASVFWLGLFTLAWLSIVVVGLSDPEASVALHFNSFLVGSLAFPCAAGWLFGLVIQEFQHTSFARQLPGVRRKLVTGFLSAGFVVTLITMALVSRLEPAPFGPALMFVLGLGAYCAGAVLLDPLSNWITTVNVVILLLVVARSDVLAGLAGEHPWVAAVSALTVGTAGLWRLFSRRTFRLKPFHLTNPLPGRFSVEKSREIELKRLIRDRAKSAGWRAGYLGEGAWAWVRAAHHEVHGGLGWKTFARALSKMWGLILIVVISAWVDRGDFSFPHALGYSLYDALFRSPHVAPFGREGGPYLMVMVVIAAAGVVTAMRRPVALGNSLLYPLSRPQLARVAFRCSLVDAAILFLVLGVGLFAIGHGVGLLVGFEPRFNFMPYYLRALLLTLALLPLGHWGRYRLQIRQRRKAENTIVPLVFSVVGFVVAVGVGIWFLPLMFPTPLPEFALLAVAFVFTHLIYRNKLREYYRTADLT